jgi:GNAT superfamily N-acetyltransferase
VTPRRALGSSIGIRAFAMADADPLSVLFDGYMRETYGEPWSGSAEALRRDAAAGYVGVLVAEESAGIRVGFLVWVDSYDAHHCVRGAEVLDLYVAPRWRGRGVAVRLIAAAAAEIARGGGRYVRGSVAGSGSGHRLYRRIGICDPCGCIVSGRAFRRLGDLGALPLREIVRALPPQEWNREG